MKKIYSLDSFFKRYKYLQKVTWNIVLFPVFEELLVFTCNSVVYYVSML